MRAERASSQPPAGARISKGPQGPEILVKDSFKGNIKDNFKGNFKNTFKAKIEDNNKDNIKGKFRDILKDILKDNVKDAELQIIYRLELCLSERLFSCMTV